MRKIITIIMLLLMQLSIFAVSSDSETRQIEWKPVITDYFEIKLYKDNTEIPENGDIVLSVDEASKKASAKVNLKWAIVSESDVAVYITPADTINAEDGTVVPWCVYEDGSDESGKRGVNEELLVYPHYSSTSVISNQMEEGDGRDIIIEADLSNVSSSIADHETTLKVGIRSMS